MGFKATLIGAVLLSGMLGGALAQYGASGQPTSVSHIASDAKDMFRNTMRKFDKRYYTRGPDYGLCIADYGRTAFGKTNAEITFACECFDKNLRMIGGLDRESARAALRAPAQSPAQSGKKVATLQATAVAKAVLARCEIKPAPSGFLSMRGTM